MHASIRRAGRWPLALMLMTLAACAERPTEQRSTPL